MFRIGLRYVLLRLLTIILQASVSPYRRDAVDQIVEFPSDIWMKMARTHAP